MLTELFQEARHKWEEWLKKQEDSEQRKNELVRSFVSSEIVERPIAGAILRTGSAAGGDADNSWFYLQPTDKPWKELAEALYSSPRKKFSYAYSQLGISERMFKFSSETSTFTLNINHQFVAAYSTDFLSKNVLHDFILAEVVLEAQLRLSSVAPTVIGEVLEERDKLLRSLAKDHPLSSHAVAQQLRDARSHQYDLEVALVAVARALGFVAKHISGSGEPDIVARFVEYPRKDTLIIIEAKSSGGVPTLAHLDFGGIDEHVANTKANGCMLVAPAFPGDIEEGESAVDRRSRNLRISCWTLDTLVNLVENIERRYISARDVLDIVLNTFAPSDVSNAVGQLLSQPSWNRPALNNAIVEAIDSLAAHMPDSPRTVDMISARISARPEFAAIEVKDVRRAVADLAAASQGGLAVDGDAIVPLTSIEELKRRLSAHLSIGIQPRRLSSIRGDLPANQNEDEGH